MNNNPTAESFTSVASMTTPTTTCATCQALQKELYEARMYIARQEGQLSVLRNNLGSFSEKISYEFLSNVCNRKFTVDVLRGGAKSFASYLIDNVMPGRVSLTSRKRIARYISDDGNIVEEPVVDFVSKVLESTRVRANQLYDDGKNLYIGDFCKDADASPVELAKTFANMALIRNCSSDVAREIASIVVKSF